MTELSVFIATEAASVSTVSSLLSHHPTLDINWHNRTSRDQTALHTACRHDHANIVRVLLKHPRIQVNCRDSHGWTPFLTCCYYGSSRAAWLLANDPRVDVNQMEHGGYSPLFWLSASGHVDTMRCIIASGRHLDLGEPGEFETDVIRVARHYKQRKACEIWENFKRNPEDTRYQIRVDLGLPEATGATIFALVVFLCDGLLVLKEGTETRPASQFLSIAQQLPMELQMVLCLRLNGSEKTHLPLADSEASFRALARTLRQDKN